MSFEGFGVTTFVKSTYILTYEKSYKKCIPKPLNRYVVGTINSRK